MPIDIEELKRQNRQRTLNLLQARGEQEAPQATAGALTASSRAGQTITDLTSGALTQPTISPGISPSAAAAGQAEAPGRVIPGVQRQAEAQTARQALETQQADRNRMFNTLVSFYTDQGLDYNQAISNAQALMTQTEQEEFQAQENERNRQLALQKQTIGEEGTQSRIDLERRYMAEARHNSIKDAFIRSGLALTGSIGTGFALRGLKRFGRKTPVTKPELPYTPNLSNYPTFNPTYPTHGLPYSPYSPRVSSEPEVEFK